MAAKSSATTELPLDLPVLPQGWDYVPLAKLVNEHRGISYGIVQPGSPVSNGIPIIRVNDIRDGRINESDMMRIAPDVESKYNRTRLHGGELLLTLVGTVGESAIVPKRLTGWNVARAVAVLPCDGEVSAPWVHLCLRSDTLKHFMRIWCTTTVQATLNLRDVARLPIPVPPKRERERITVILTSLDDKIELNRRMNETLEAMARRLFKSWFVDFDPVRAKAALRREHPKLSNAALSRRALPNMAPEIAELFPDSFEDSMLGLIPKGWKAGVIGDLAALDKTTVKPNAFPDEFFDHYSIPAFDKGMNPAKESGDQIKSNKFVVTPDSVLLTKLNPRIPRVWLPFPSHSRRSLCSTEFLVLKPNPGIRREFLFSLVSSRSFFEVYETMVTGTSGSHQRIRPEHLLNMEVVIPPEPVLTAFADKVGDQFTCSESLRSESHSLATTRERLLPKLLSGELSIITQEVA